MKYNYNSSIKLGNIILNVNNLEKQIEFYTKKLGLDIINKNNVLVDLGIKEDNNILITLKKTTKEKKETYGLYHVAILLPNRTELGNIFKHFLKNNIPLIGASNHGYSEAIYLEDYEGNGIEVYRDLPIEKWDIRETGEIIGITEEIDAQGVYDSANILEGETYKMPKGTIIGHVHLSVRDAQLSTIFYQNLFSINDKMTISSGSWIASGDYHHHLAVNNWKGKYLENSQSNFPGLEYFSIIYNNKINYNNFLNKVKEQNVLIVENFGENSILIEDINGIKIKVSCEN